MCGVRVFRPSASECETLDWSRNEGSRAVSGALQHVETSGARGRCGVVCLLSGGTTLHIFGRTVERLEAVICENVGFLRSDTNRFAWFVGCGSLSVRDVCFSLSRVGALAWVAVGFAQSGNWHSGGIGMRVSGGWGVSVGVPCGCHTPCC